MALALAISPAQAGFERGLEKMLGKQARNAIESQYEVIAEGPTAEYVDRVGRSLVEVSPRHDVEYTFKLLDTEQINAFALPWGYVYITTGMLQFVDSSDQLAGVVGHEIAHVAQKHSLDAFKKQFWTSLFFGVIDAPATVLTLGQVGATLYLLRHSRKDEQEADRLGAGYSYRAGYDPSQLADFLRKLDEEHGRKLGTIEVYLSTHPTGERRQERLAALAELDRGDAQVAARVAQGFLGRHQANQAVTRLRRAVALAPGEAAARAGLARAYAELGERELARGELDRAKALGLHDTREIEESLAAPPAREPEVSVAPSAAEKQVKQARTAAAAWSLEVQQPIRQIEEKAQSLERKVRGLARRMSMAGSFGQPTYTTQRVMEKARHALYLIAETTDRVAAVGKRFRSIAAGATEVAEMLERDSAAPASAADRAQWQALARDIAGGVAEAEEHSDQVVQQALEAAGLADRAAGELSSAVSAISPGVGPFGNLDRDFAFLRLAESEVDSALRMAADALAASDEARLALRGWRARELSWRLSAAYLDAPPAHRPALRRIAGAMIAADADALVPDAAAGFGAVVLRALRPEASSAGDAPERPAEGGAAGSVETADHEGLMLKLLLADVEREAEARAEWRGTSAPAPASSPSAETAATGPATN